MVDIKKQNMEVLVKAVIIAQAKGAFSLKDSALLHKVIQSILNEKSEEKIEEKDAINALVQGTNIGQKAGAYTLDDASMIFDAIKYFEEENKKTNKLETIEEISEA